MAKRSRTRAASKSSQPRTSRRRPQRARSSRPPIASSFDIDGAVDGTDAGTGDQPLSHTIVGIGASAGGVEAVTKLLQHLTADSGLAYVLVQHLAPKHDSVLADVLRVASRIPVVQAEQQMRILPNRLHVIPPNVQMTVSDGHLHLAPRPTDRTQYNPIDSFFQSLAQHIEHRAVGVVLSGSASDGAIGLREIKSAGGFTMAQDPRTARYDGMPRAAIATGAVDLVLPVEGIAEELVRLGTHPFVAPGSQGRTLELSITDPQLERLFYLLRGASTVDFSHYKLPTIKRRLQRRMALHKVIEVDKYLKILDHDAAELRNLYRDLLIHVTRFFRDPESFERLQRLVFPKIVSDAAAKRPVRVWVPGCATGEEAYSLAIALIEHLGDDAASVPVQVFATDVSEEAIERARAGVYPDSIAADVPPERLRRFFTRADGQYRISKLVRDSCIFARQDLTRDPPFSKLDLIACRNVLIYLGPRLQRKLMGVFHYALKPSGFLMLGATETVGAQAELFAILDKKHKIYTRRNGVRDVGVDLPLGDFTYEREPIEQRHSRPARIGSDLQSEVNRLLLGRYTPPGVVVDSDLRIVHTRGRTGLYLELAAGEASLNLLKMAREGVLHGLRSALNEAKKSGKPARRDSLQVNVSGVLREVDVHVVPFDAAGTNYFMVLFEDPLRAPALKGAASARKRAGKERKDPRVARLQQELTSSREYLQSIIQDLEAANEELQSANEEILSSNEELQSTNEELDTAKEELQSSNEELNTVNEELNARNEELSLVNADLVNLLAAVPAAIVIVTSDLRVRRFTPTAEQVLSLIPTDIGRPLRDMRMNMNGPDLEDLAREAIDNVAPQECEVLDRAGRTYILRIRPYKDQENRIDGAVLSFTDK